MADMRVAYLSQVTNVCLMYRKGINILDNKWHNKKNTIKIKFLRICILNFIKQWQILFCHVDQQQTIK
jgi:plasmid rolling circle replication initiator protein Rep